MSTSRWFNKICAAAMALCLVLTAVLMGGKASGIQSAPRTAGYESRLFDTSKVHSIDIVINDWDGFLEDCESEQYSYCAVVIDGEKVRNVGLRAKGNTSLSNVRQSGSSRYSLKLEFDHYQNGNTYHGLDKLCLNNLIQDDTMMKDYLAYRMMADFGAEAPLCSYAYVTINGEDWGLFLAVEGLEDSFLQRVYGTETGDLYKPDTISFGGGRGNGQGFKMSEFDFEQFGPRRRNTDGSSDSVEDSSEAFEFSGGFPDGMPDFSGGDFPDFSGGFPGFSGMGGQSGSSDTQFPGFGGFPGFSMDGQSGSSDAQVPGFSMGDMPSGDMSSGGMPDMGSSDAQAGSSDTASGGFPSPGSGGPGGGGFPGFGGMGSNDVKLQYTDDDPDSYSNIFSSAKTDVTDGDKARLISALRTLSQQVNGEDADLASALNIDEVLRYLVVHNFVVNGDSYTGSMIHNYYLHERDGQLSMIPWDYNLAYGTFQASNATSSVNDPIDTPLSVNGDGDRPMADWVYSSEEYTALYHQYFAEFLDSFDLDSFITETAALIDEYVQKDPTKFCTYEEFLTGVETLREFCRLRVESVRGQLDGTIPSTEEGQEADSSALVDASDLTLSNLGSMGGGGFGGGPNSGGSSGSGFPSFGGGGRGGGGHRSRPGSSEETVSSSETSGMLDMPEMPGSSDMSGMPDASSMPDMANVPDASSMPDMANMPDASSMPDLANMPDMANMPAQ